MASSIVENEVSLSGSVVEVCSTSGHKEVIIFDRIVRDAMGRPIEIVSEDGKRFLWKSIFWYRIREVK